MQSKEQFDSRIKWLNDNISKYEGYKKQAVIERFNELRNELKKTINSLDLKFRYNDILDEFCYYSHKLNLDKVDFYDIEKINFYKDSLLFKELIDLIDNNNHLSEELIN